VEAVLLALASWFEAIGLRSWASATPWVYPAANVLHVLGLAMLLGTIGILDLRVAGLWRRLPLADLSRALTPVAVLGLLVLASSGIVLFAADGTALAASSTFRIKLLLVALALVNAAVFRLLWQRKAEQHGGAPSPLARLSAACSLGLWISIATLGRLIAYN